ncbi:MAG: hypothetical protein NZ869_07795, partial [Thermoanaerobaculum sp.]|nr:hypothetical protein [Thermoanaerobaculum sp.]
HRAKPVNKHGKPGDKLVQILSFSLGPKEAEARIACGRQAWGCLEYGSTSTVKKWSIAEVKERPDGKLYVRVMNLVLASNGCHGAGFPTLKRKFQHAPEKPRSLVVLKPCVAKDLALLFP